MEVKVEEDTGAELQVEAPDPIGGGHEQEMGGGEQQVEQQAQQAPEEAEVEGCEEGSILRFERDTYHLVVCVGADDDDEARSEATFRFRVENFSAIKDSTLSESCVIR